MTAKKKQSSARQRTARPASRANSQAAPKSSAVELAKPSAETEAPTARKTAANRTAAPAARESGRGAAERKTPRKNPRAAASEPSKSSAGPRRGAKGISPRAEDGLAPAPPAPTAANNASAALPPGAAATESCQTERDASCGVPPATDHAVTPPPPQRSSAAIAVRGAKDRTRLGTKWNCFGCGARFYDLGREPAICPKCRADQAQRPLETERAPSPPRAPVGRAAGEKIHYDEPSAATERSGGDEDNPDLFPGADLDHPDVDLEE